MNVNTKKIVIGKPSLGVSKKKCETCMGFGLWAIGHTSPMGPIDASDGCPTKACPECGANANPYRMGDGDGYKI